MHADDVRLLGIPRSRRIIANVDPQHGSVSQGSQCSRIRGRCGVCWHSRWCALVLPNAHHGYHPNSTTDKKLVAGASVARERPRTSESITDLLSPHASPGYNTGGPSKNALWGMKPPQVSKNPTDYIQENPGCPAYLHRSAAGITPQQNQG